MNTKTLLLLMFVCGVAGGLVGFGIDATLMMASRGAGIGMVAPFAAFLFGFISNKDE